MSGLFKNSGKLVSQEIPLGDVNGINKDFVIEHTPRDNSLHLFEGGQLLFGSGNDYTLVGMAITFVDAPTGRVTASYKY